MILLRSLLDGIDSDKYNAVMVLSTEKCNQHRGSYFQYDTLDNGYRYEFLSGIFADGWQADINGSFACRRNRSQFPEAMGVQWCSDKCEQFSEYIGQQGNCSKLRSQIHAYYVFFQLDNHDG